MYSQQNNEQQTVDGLAAALPCKTPVSLLQELCMRRGISPKYDLLQIEGAVHEPTFVYRVTVGEFTANGSGQSKKKAKHSAAKAVLDIIIHGGGAGAATGNSNHNSDSSLATNNTGLVNADGQGELSGMVVSPYDDGIPGNPVGQLQELCMTRRWPPPTYEPIKEEGFPHERTFTIACTIATHKEVGIGKSKKLAKRQAAYSMLQKLRDLPQGQEPHSGLTDDDDEVLTGSAVPDPVDALENNQDLFNNRHDSSLDTHNPYGDDTNLVFGSQQQGFNSHTDYTDTSAIGDNLNHQQESSSIFGYDQNVQKETLFDNENISNFGSNGCVATPQTNASKLAALSSRVTRSGTKKVRESLAPTDVQRSSLFPEDDDDDAPETLDEELQTLSI